MERRSRKRNAQKGDYREDSDYDVMILTTLEHNYEFEDKKRKARYQSYYLDVEINPVFQNTKFFNEWKEASPYYSNIVKECE